MALKGKTTIQIFDGESGELVNEIREENMITNAVDTILNPPDYIEMGIDRDTDRSYNILPVFKHNLADTAFRGVIVCRDAIPEDANNMMLPWTNEEVGHAGIANTNTDKTIGTYNSNESGVIENGKGYRHVWDFGTDKANGEIGCVCMTTKDGGTNGYHNTYWSLSAGGLDFNSSSTGSFQQSSHAFLGRNIHISTFDATRYKWFYINKLENGDIRFLGKHVYNGAVYEVVMRNPYVLHLRNDEPVGQVKSVKKVIELFPAPTRVPKAFSTTEYFHGSEFIDTNQSSINYVPAEDKQRLIDAWNSEPQWMPYFPYVHQGKIHIIAQSPVRIYHYIYDVNTYEKISENVIETEVSMQNYNIGFNLVQINNGTPYYRWFYGASPSTDYNNAMCGFFWDDKYFSVPKNPLIDGKIAEGTNNFGQFRIFNKDGSVTDSILQYYGNGNLASLSYGWWGFYIDEVTNTPIVIAEAENNYYMLALMVRKTSKGYGFYRMRITIPTYGTNSVYSYGTLVKIEDMSFPLYCVPYYPYNSGNDNRYWGFAISAMKLFLTTINNLTSPVRKLEGQTMKITYDIVEE